jgi:hypothetical protein
VTTEPGDRAARDLVAVCSFRVASGRRDDLIALLADVLGAVEGPGEVTAHWGGVAVDGDTIEISLDVVCDASTMAPVLAEMVADLAEFGVTLAMECDLIGVGQAEPALATLDKSLTITRIFEETLIGCAIGCGCAVPGWDSAEAIAELAGGPAANWYRQVDALVSPRAMLRYLEYADAHVQEADLPKVRTITDRQHHSVAEFRRVLSPRLDRLRAVVRDHAPR